MKKIALVGTGRIGTNHAQILATEIDGIELDILADPLSPELENLANQLGVPRTTRNIADIAADPTIDGVVIAAPAALHLELVNLFATAGKHIFTEKPLALSMENAEKVADIAADTGVIFQIGFNRRYGESWAKAKNLITTGALGDIHYLYSITRDPGPWLGDPTKVAPGTIFNETLIHDFDTLNWLNEGAEPVSVYAVADALVRPDAKGTGFFDSSTVNITYDNGSMAQAQASFSAMYGYDLRGEVLGSEGMVQMGSLPNTALRFYDSQGMNADTLGTDTSRFHEAYRDEFQAFADALNGKNNSYPTATDGLRAQQIAAAAIKSVAEGRVVAISEVATKNVKEMAK